MSGVVMVDILISWRAFQAGKGDIYHSQYVPPPERFSVALPPFQVVHYSQSSLLEDQHTVNILNRRAPPKLNTISEMTQRENGLECICDANTFDSPESKNGTA
uniref:Uncharacterized protein n=1 Tax=Graphocephala atropunctata TaxID=36148 RepID=A0A1B6KGA3_9HEMI